MILSLINKIFKNKTEYCPICDNHRYKDEMESMSGSDYQYWASSEVCIYCLNGN